MPPLYSARRIVRLQDVDAAGVVFFARVLEYLNDTYLEFLASRGIAVAKLLHDRVWGTPVARVEADYQSPLRFGDEFEVMLDEARLGDTSLRLEYRIEGRAAGHPLHCRGAMVHVCIDLATFRPRPLPEELRSAFSPREDAAAG